MRRLAIRLGIALAALLVASQFLCRRAWSTASRAT